MRLDRVATNARAGSHAHRSPDLIYLVRPPRRRWNRTQSFVLDLLSRFARVTISGRRNASSRLRPLVSGAARFCARGTHLDRTVAIKILPSISVRCIREMCTVDSSSSIFVTGVAVSRLL